MTHPILYSFRRCPFAMRARLAIKSAGIRCELREILLRDKAPLFLETSPKGTVPVIVDGPDIIEESLDIMIWALRQNDPEGWLRHEKTAMSLIDDCDGPFKTSLDRYKYASRNPDADSIVEREKASLFLRKLDKSLSSNNWLEGDVPTLVDMATITFVRQFAHVDLDWFQSQPWPNLIRWLEAFKASKRFKGIMQKYPKWESGDVPVVFP